MFVGTYADDDDDYYYYYYYDTCPCKLAPKQLGLGQAAVTIKTLSVSE